MRGINWKRGADPVALQRDRMLKKNHVQEVLFPSSSLAVCLLPGSFASAFETKGQDCIKCHTLTKEEARDLLKDFYLDLKILEVKSSPIEAFWEIFMDSRGQKGIVYIDFSKKHFVFGSIISIKEKKNLSQERLTDLTRVDVSQIPLDDALVMGDPKARIRVIVFDDPDCPFCAQFHPEMKKIVAERKDIVFYLKMFPIASIHPEAYQKAKAIVCEKSMALLEDSFQKKTLPQPKCETSVIDENISLAQKLSIAGTPALILPDGRVIFGYKDAKTLLGIIGQ